MRFSQFKSIPLSLIGTVVLTIVLSLVILTSLAPPLTAGDCAIGGCDCGSCGESCKTGSIRIDFYGVSVVYYDCLCPGTYCQGTAI